MALWVNIIGFANGETLEDDVLNRPVRQLRERTDYLYGRLMALAGSDMFESVRLLDAPLTMGTALEPAVLAPMLYGPSYLSFESALRFHGLIPDVVQNAAAATSRRSRVFDTALGHFTFTTVPVNVLMAGVRIVTFEIGSQTVTGLVASPARAIADLVYTRREVSWKNDGRRFLEESMRIDRDELAAKLRPEELEATLATFRHRRVRAFIEGLRLSLARPPKTGRNKKGKPR